MPFACLVALAGVKRFTDLAAWQRGYELLVLCEELLQRKHLRFENRFREQLTDASSSVPRNVAEGFGRFRARENAQYVRVAKGSASEVLSLLFEAHARGQLTAAEFPRFKTAADRAIGTLVGYLRYLESCEAPRTGTKRMSAPRPNPRTSKTANTPNPRKPPNTGT